jgi:hypothetical protein
MALTVHPVCRLFPAMSDEELNRLADDIRRRGLLHPIVVHQGAILDGRHRLEACRRARVKPRFANWDGKGSLVDWIVAQNVGRRQLTPSQKAVIALELLPLLEAEAKQGLRPKRGRPKKSAHQCALFSGDVSVRKPVRRTDEAAHIMAASPRYVQIAQRLKRKAPEVLPLVAEGKIHLRDAERLAKIDVYRRRSLVLRIEQSPGEDLDVRPMMRKQRDLYYGELIRLLPDREKYKHGVDFHLTPDLLRLLDEGYPVPITIAGRRCHLTLVKNSEQAV